MSFIDRDDDEFERTLLRSASRDVPNAVATEEAWSRFVAVLAGVMATVGVPKPVAAPPGTAGSTGRFARYVSAARWLGLGAIGGSAVTIALVGAHSGLRAPASSIDPTSTMRSPPAFVMPPLEPAAQSAGAAPESDSRPMVSSTSSVSRSWGRGFTRNEGQGTKAQVSPTRGFALASRDGASLAAEVAALDVARSALDAAMPDEALTVLGDYLRDFPRGKLVPEAEVMGIEALAAKGERDRVTKEATRFLQRYPTAPQRTRVAHLLAEAGGT